MTTEQMDEVDAIEAIEKKERTISFQGIVGDSDSEPLAIAIIQLAMEHNPQGLNGRLVRTMRPPNMANLILYLIENGVEIKEKIDNLAAVVKEIDSIGGSS